MSRAITFLALLRSAAPAAALMLVIAFFGGYALIGTNGVMAWGDYSRQLDQRQIELAVLKREKAILENRVSLLNPKQANPDLADEMVRRDLGLTHPDEVIIPLD